jgi:hypothetical protein
MFVDKLMGGLKLSEGMAPYMFELFGTIRFKSVQSCQQKHL